ncbi:hypothetical protein PAPYR_2765 [Paratrimastix pyriformis]|uniref:F-box domain-containing protein n=1 Tax=Paratrimastix pyriformis TaxID=342808 RepID=A0ABQ8UP08_9EUKA|nr:hypothetical protein PAPYR_2765 [Paratrimastix pyriformis]
MSNVKRHVCGSSHSSFAFGQNFFGGPTRTDRMEQLPADLLVLIFRDLNTGKALATGSLVSRRMRDVLWTNDTLWHSAFENEFGGTATQAVETHGTARRQPGLLPPPQPSTDPPASPLIVTGWRQKYTEHKRFLSEVESDRQARFKRRKELQRRDIAPSAEDRLNFLIWLILSPIFFYIALPLLLALIILRSENIIQWSLHAVLAPADFLFFCGLGGFFAFTESWGSTKMVLTAISCIFPVAVATIHWAAARADWIVATGTMHSPDTPGGLNWMFIFTPGMAIAVGIIVVANLFLPDAGTHRDDFFVVLTLGMGARCLRWPSSSCWASSCSGAPRVPLRTPSCPCGASPSASTSSFYDYTGAARCGGSC